MRKILIALSLILTYTYSEAQLWKPVNSGILSPGSVAVWSLYPYDSVLYAGGWFDTAGTVSVSDMAQFNGVNWSTPGIGTNGYINAMAVYRRSLYVGGEFDSIGGIAANSIAMWNGSNWSAVGKGEFSAQYGIYAMTVYNGELYIGGSIDSVDGKSIYGIAKYNGSTWSALGSGIYAADEEDGVFALAVYKGELYVGGGFDSAGGVPVKEIAKWNDTTWSSVGKGMNDGGSVAALNVFNGNLYAGGMFDTAGGIAANRIAMWNGSVWSPLDSGITGEATWASVNTMATFNNELYVGGYFDTVNGKPINCIAKWNGSLWSALGSGISNGGSVTSMAVYNNALYVGGGFDSAGGVYAKNIAMWTNPNGIENINDQAQLYVYPNPTRNILYVNSKIPEDSKKYTIYNELGENIQQGKLISSISKIDVSGLTAGLYLVSLSDGNKLYTTKFIKK